MCTINNYGNGQNSGEFLNVTMSLHVVCSVAQSCLTLCDPVEAHQAPLSMEFSRKEYWNGQSFPSPGDFYDPGIGPRSSTLQADSLPSEPPGKFNVIIYTHTQIYAYIYVCAYSCLGNLKDRGAWKATVHGVAKSRTQLSN